MGDSQHTTDSGSQPGTMLDHLTTDPVGSMLRRLKEWDTLEVRNEGAPGFMPSIGYTPSGGSVAFAPKPKTTGSAGNVLACVAEMGRGKSTMIRNFQRDTITGQAGSLVQHNPSARFLLLTANRMYAASAAREQQALAESLRAQGFTAVVAGSYMTPDVNLAACQYVLCSLESLHHVEGQRFDVVILDEVGSLARLVGGGTMVELGNVFLLRSLCSQMGTRVITLDADLLFKLDQSEPRTVVEDFFRLVMPERSVLCAKLTGPKPSHLQRSVRLYFDHSVCDGKAGLEEWWAGIESQVRQWHATQGGSGLIIIDVGTKALGREICRRLKDLKAPHEFYHGDSDQEKRFAHFSNPRDAWRPLCAIVATTVKAIGVDIPQEIKVAQVFAAFCRMGCAFQQLCQALLRARHVDNPEMWILIDCMPPPVRALLEQQGKRRPIVPPTYDESLKTVTAKRAAGIRLHERMLAAAGGLPAGVAGLKHLGDDALRVMAHARLERSMQVCDPFRAATRLFEHHGWDTRLGLEQQVNDQFDISGLPALSLSDDAEFDIMKTDKEKWTWVVVQIMERGVEGFFDQCYGLATKSKTSSNTLAQGEQWMVKAFWALKNIGHIPGLETADDRSVDGVQTGETEGIDAPSLLTAWLGNGSDHKNLTPALQLHAYCRIFLPDEAMKREFTDRLDTLKRKRDPQLALLPGMKLTCVERLGKLILGGGYRRPAQLVEERVDIAQRFVDIANRGILKTPTESDKMDLTQLHGCKADLDVGDKGNTVLELLSAVAKAIGMKLVAVKHQPVQPDGTRPKLVRSMHLERLLPGVGDLWLIDSPLLGKHVRVADWADAHAAAQLDAVERGWAADEDYGDLFTAHNTDTTDAGDMRYEKINAARLDSELTRLRHFRNTLNSATLTDANARELRCLQVLEAIDSTALRVDNDGIRRLCVVYSKRKGIGRRTASYPSMQSCPSSLRPLLQRFYYHDIDMANCHPSLMIQVAEKMGKRAEIPKLVEYVNNRDAMLQRIADHFKVVKSSCKFAVLRVLNGGSVAEWCKEMGLPASTNVKQRDLDDLTEEARVIRRSFFAMIDRDHSPGTLSSLREQVRAVKGKDASNVSIDRAVFSHCMFEVEDSVLDVIDRYFREHGWDVGSLIYDGMHIGHRKGDTQDPATERWVQLEAAMRGAEAYALAKTGYNIKLCEKPLFEEQIECGEEDDVECAEESDVEIEYTEG